MSFFEQFQAAAADPIFGLNAILKQDNRENKIDLLIGYYKNELNQVPVFQAITHAEKFLIGKKLDFNYLPIDGNQGYLDSLKSLIFDQQNIPFVYGAQTVGGTSALHHLGKLITLKGGTSIAIPEPTWANHRQIFQYLGLNVRSYPYYDVKSQTLLWDEFKSFLNTLDSSTVLLLHASCHNPSGADLSYEQWKEVAQICQTRGILPFFDCAYQGFGSGLKEDVASINLFSEYVSDMIVAYSCSKNFGLYGERTGALFCFSKVPKTLEKLSSLIKQSIRATYSNPPKRGSMLVNQILSDETLRHSWQAELHSYLERIQYNQKQYKDRLEYFTGKNFDYVIQRKGLFIFTGLNSHQVQKLREDDAIYLSSDGRLNITGLNQSNIETVTKALAKYL